MNKSFPLAPPVGTILKIINPQGTGLAQNSSGRLAKLGHNSLVRVIEITQGWPNCYGEGILVEYLDDKRKSSPGLIFYISNNKLNDVRQA